MNGVTNKSRLVEKRYGDELKKDKKENRLNSKKHKKQSKKLEKLKKTITIIIINYKKKQKTIQNYKKNNMKKKNFY